MKKNGFTLIEVIVTTVLVALAGLATYSAFRSGISVWARTAQAAATDEAYLVLERLSKDLHNAFPFALAENTWEEHRIIFPSLVSKVVQKDEETSKDQEDKPEYEQTTEMGWVQYIFSSDKEGTLYRSQGKFGEKPSELSDFAEQSGQPGKVVLKNVSDATFSFIFPEKDSEKSFPISVKVEINTNAASAEAKEDNIITRTIYIPVAKEVAEEKEKQ